MKKITFLFLLLLMGVVSLAQEDMGNYDPRIPIFGDARGDAPELAPRGEHHVGVTTLTLINAGIGDVLNADTDPSAITDRELVIEVWYPAIIPADATELELYTDNLILEGFQFYSRAFRDARPEMANGPYSLIIISHGLSGNRLQMTYLADNLASKGYVVAAIDHADGMVGLESIQTATYYRPVDIQFTLDSLASLSTDERSIFNGLVDTDNTGLIGYSYGGYGVLVSSGAGLAQQVMSIPLLVPGQLAEANLLENVTRDPRIKATYTFAPFGNDLRALGLPFGYWSADSLAAIDIPLFIEAGSLDDVAHYQTGVVPVYDGVVNTQRYFLTILEARHNVAPNPSPPVTSADQFLRYGEAAWDSQRLNNIAQHFTTAFFGLYLLGDENYAPYLDLVEVASEGSSDAGTQWTGFPDRTAIGMTFRSSPAGE